MNLVNRRKQYSKFIKEIIHNKSPERKVLEIDEFDNES